MNVFVAEGMHPAGMAQLEKAGFKIITPKEHFDSHVVDIIVVRSVFPVDEAAFRQYPNLKVVAKLGTGLDNIDLQLCCSRGLEVINAPAMNSISTAEFTVAQILNIYKNSFEIHDRVRQRDFRRALYYGRELTDMTAGVIGYGNVGKAIVARLRPFVRKVYIRDNHTEGNKEDGDLHFVADQDALLSQSDAVILAVTLKNNEKMVNSDFLSKLRKDALLVNIARGGIIDEPTLIEFLKKNIEARYYCDVLTREPDYDKTPTTQDYKNPLLELPNVSYTPHIANLTDQCQKKIALAIADKIIKYRRDHVDVDRDTAIR